MQAALLVYILVDMRTTMARARSEPKPLIQYVMISNIQSHIDHIQTVTMYFRRYM